MKNILISAFLPFGDYPENSSRQVVSLETNRGLCEYHVSPMYFAASIPNIDRGLLLLNAAQYTGTRGIICLGMASQKKGLCLETRTSNLVQNVKYCRPNQNGKPVDLSRPLGECLEIDLSKWNVDKFETLCQNTGIPSERSQDAGGFCCNHLMFQICSAQLRDSRLREIPWIYFHIPCTQEAVPVPPDEFIKAGKTTMALSDIYTGLIFLLRGASI